MSEIKSVEQTTAIIDSVTKAIDAATPETVVQVQPDPNYWWLLLIGIVPVLLAFFLNHKKALPWQRKKKSGS